jgi:hypothetical protein
MGVELRLPDIKGNDREMLVQIRSYLYQLIPQLQFALNDISTIETRADTPTPKSLTYSNITGDVNAQSTFNSIKALIIKSADIVNAYYEEISSKLEGMYVAQSEFGAYVEQTSQEIEENSISTTQRFENIQAILNETKTELVDAKTEFTGMIEGVDAELQETKTLTNDRMSAIDGDLQESKETINGNIQSVQDSVTGTNALLEDAKSQLQGSIDNLDAYVTALQEVIIGVTAYLKSGLLYYTDGGIPVYGLEIGQSVKDEVSGEEAFKKYARFTSEKLSFYDSNDVEVAYISDRKLFIRMAQITISFQIGGLIDLVMPNGDIVTKWVGIGD